MNIHSERRLKELRQRPCLLKCIFKNLYSNPFQSSPSLATLVPFWLRIPLLVFFFLSKLLFLGFLAHGSKYHDVAPLRNTFFFLYVGPIPKPSQFLSYILLTTPYSSDNSWATLVRTRNFLITEEEIGIHFFPLVREVIALKDYYLVLARLFKAVFILIFFFFTFQ